MLYRNKLIFCIILIVISIKFWNYYLYIKNKCFSPNIKTYISNTNKVNLRILSYNLFLLPNPFFYNLLDHPHSDYKNDRCLLISKIIKNFDIILFQEVHPGHNYRCNFIIDEARKYGLPYHYYHLGPSFLSKYCLSNGLLIISRFPILETDCISFSQSKSYDNFMEKGSLYAKIKLSHKIPPIHIFNSHLQSSYSKEKTWETIRDKQLKELNVFMKSKCNFLKDYIISGGDFNINHYDKEYNILSKTLAPLKDIYHLDKKISHTIVLPYTPEEEEDNNLCLICKKCKLPDNYKLEKQKLDYIFYSPNISILEKKILPNYVKKSKYKFNRLSDHYAIYSKIRIKLK